MLKLIEILNEMLYPKLDSTGFPEKIKSPYDNSYKIENFWFSAPKRGNDKLENIQPEGKYYFQKGEIFWKKHGSFTPEEGGQLLLSRLDDSYFTPELFDKKRDDFEQSQGAGTILGQEINDNKKDFATYEYRRDPIEGDPNNWSYIKIK